MATIAKSLLASSFISKSTNFAKYNFNQIRNALWVNRWMARDVKRRKLAEQYAAERARILALKRNDVLPIEIRQLASKQMNKTIPRQTALRQLTLRCAVTSRARGTVYDWRLSRIVFRHLADYNKLAGVQRAMW